MTCIWAPNSIFRYRMFRIVENEIAITFRNNTIVIVIWSEMLILFKSFTRSNCIRHWAFIENLWRRKLKCSAIGAVVRLIYVVRSYQFMNQSRSNVIHIFFLSYLTWIHQRTIYILKLLKWRTKWKYNMQRKSCFQSTWLLYLCCFFSQLFLHSFLLLFQDLVIVSLPLKEKWTWQFSCADNIQAMCYILYIA